jgi:SAM-dependent methyltransferase
VAPLEVVLLCPAGFESVVSRAARNELARFRLVSTSGGFVRGQTDASVRSLRSFPCATNVFQVIATTARTHGDRDLSAMAKLGAPRPGWLPRAGTVRLRVHEEGGFVTTSTPASRQLEAAISKWSGLPISRASASVEAWVLRRAQVPDAFLTIKLTRGERPTRAGELRPEVCAALARVRNVSGAGLVLDPFAGTGGVGRALAAAGAKAVILNDLRRPRPAEPGKTFEKIRWVQGDFRDLDLEGDSVDAVVTDPPWGHFDPEVDIDAAYLDLGRLASRWLKPGGFLVVLTAAQESVIDQLFVQASLGEEERLPVLISGRKALVLVARKK